MVPTENLHPENGQSHTSSALLSISEGGPTLKV